MTRATESPVASRVRTAMTLIELARRLRADGEFGRAQEALYYALDARDAWPEGISALAMALGFAPTVVGRRESLVMELAELKRKDSERAAALAPSK